MKIKPIHIAKFDGVSVYDDEMSEKDLFEAHRLPLKVLLANNIVVPRDYKKTFGRNRYQTIYKYTNQSIKEDA